ncbi:unnamed protein product [Anisakis simplex]|uniref:Sucrase-isomaltase, intestinal n=1 Tax=Anisakis simplex TaxID=6269 RepID=A0A0M3JQY3_ANISI|nr:unnamed protein product [Anisakis simplex]
MIVQRFPLNSAQTGFRESVVPLPKWMHQCQQYFDDVFCCFPDRLPKSEIHCDMQDGQDPWVAPGNFWQTLQVDGTMVVQHFAEYNILDTKKRLIYPVKFDEKPLDLRPASFFFPMENIMDLTEIAIRDDRFFFICEYVKLNIQQFRLVGDTDEKCHKTSFIKKDGMRGLRFCTNPIYHAIIQYDTLRPREHLYMQWQLQVSYREDDRKIYKYDAVNISPSGQIVMECNITEINVYVTGDGVLLKYVISLPKSDLKSLLGNSF